MRIVLKCQYNQPPQRCPGQVAGSLPGHIAKTRGHPWILNYVNPF